MLADLGDLVRFGAEFTHYEPEGAGVRAHFANGDSVVADVLVGADGVGSRVRGQLLPHAEVVDTGNRVIYGKVFLDATTRSPSPRPFAASRIRTLLCPHWTVSGFGRPRSG
jgi:2-polyprenyl-6-methoxyphenol hydroxylase-like FAD-dependent oxidoreductase